MKKYLSFVLLSFALVSCKEKQEEPEMVQKPIARAFESYLYEEDLKKVVPPGLKEEDSISFVKNFINKWMENELLLKKAEYNLPLEEIENIEEQLKSYKEQLIIYAYQTELLNQQLDTNVSEQSIIDYYEQNKDNFELKDYIVKVTYLRLEKNSPDIKKVKKWYKSNDKKEQMKLEEYCHKYAVNFKLEDGEWVYFNDLLMEVPIETVNVEDFLRRNKAVEIEDDEYLHLVRFYDYKLKDGISPLSLEKDNIRNIIINMRKIEMLEKVKKEIFEDALSKSNIETY